MAPVAAAARNGSSLAPESLRCPQSPILVKPSGDRRARVERHPHQSTSALVGFAGSTFPVSSCTRAPVREQGASPASARRTATEGGLGASEDAISRRSRRTSHAQAQLDAVASPAATGIASKVCRLGGTRQDYKDRADRFPVGELATDFAYALVASY